MVLSLITSHTYNLEWNESLTILVIFCCRNLPLTNPKFDIGIDQLLSLFSSIFRECIRNLDLRVQVHPGELWVSKQWVHIVLEASKSEVQKVMSQKSAGSCTRCTRSNAFPGLSSKIANQWPLFGRI